ncbi:hypothetical protein QR685DRAFT_188925 [Neurospora intermedia]|uniref:Uncharacterized protein n=1 Tax=Neurospora intermedia TaxID=5142 RepID=A0ABR3DPZ5_NEUIN
MRFLSRAFFSIFVSLSDSHGPMVLSASSSPFGFCVISFGFLSSSLKLRSKRLILLYTFTFARCFSLVFLMICFQNLSNAGYQIFTKAKSVSRSLTRTRHDKFSSSFWRFSNFVSFRISFRCVRKIQGGISVPIYPLRVSYRCIFVGLWMFLIQIPIFHVPFPGMRFHLT